MKTYTKLTPALKDLLARMKADARLKIHQRHASYSYYPRLDGRSIGKGKRGSRTQYEKLDSGAFRFLNVFFTKEKDDRNHECVYSLRPDAEPTDEWRIAEIERQRIAKEEKERTALARVEEESRRAGAYFGDGFYSVRMQSESPFTGIIRAGGVGFAAFTPHTYSSRDTFDDLIKRPENIEHYDRIKQFLVDANAGRLSQDTKTAESGA